MGDSSASTGDTEPCDAVAELAQGCAVLLSEAAGFDADRPQGHLSAGDAGRLARDSGAQLLILTHPRAWHDQLALLSEAAADTPAP